MAERRVPRIRFKGFEEDWEQRKLRQIIQAMPFKAFIKEPEDDGKYEVVQQGNEPIIGYACGLPYKDFADVVVFGDHTLSLYKPEAPFFVATDGVRIIKGVKNTDGNYLFSLLNRYKPNSEGYKRYYGILLNEQCFESQNKMEQKKIGKLFKQLDSLLSLHQRKLEKLKILKKAMLEKMFPKNGEKVPESRFSGFADDWEQRKLGEMAVISTGYPFNSNEFSPEGKYLVITNGNIQDSFTNVDESVGNRITLLDRKILDSYILDIGDILITMDGTVGRTAKVAGNGLILAQRVGRVKPIGNTEFMYQALSTGDFSKAMTELSHGGTIKHISLNEISLFEFKSPVREREQNTVGKLLYLFDTLLSLHQRKLEKLRQIKKSMLERMFV